MVLSFSGDPFLARRAALAALAENGVQPGGAVQLGEGMTPHDVQFAASQGGLFGQAALLLDFGEAFTGQAGVKPRNDTIKALADLKDGALIVVIDPEATPARQKSLAELGRHTNLPAPRFERLVRWVAQELEREGVEFGTGVAQYLADVFGEDPAGIASEVQKLAVLAGSYDVERVSRIVNRPVTRDSFDIIEAVAAGDAGKAVAVAHQLVEEGEAVPKILGALVWQFMLVTRAVALTEDAGARPPSASEAARVLKAKPFVAQRALALARRLGEADLLPLLRGLLEADVKAKSGSDPQLALESVIIDLAQRLRVRA
ncbi:MAG: DNA polymerase III subunit delta [Trueperaceae bacterium]